MTAAKGLVHSMQGRPGLARLLWVGTLLVDLFVVGMVALVVMQNREREASQAVALTDNYSRILEEDLAGFISKIDITLLTVRDEVVGQMGRGGLDRERLEAFLARQDGHIPEALGLRVVDARGVIRYAVNDVKVRNASIADRPQFIRLRDDPAAGLVFSEPLFGRAAEKWMITLGRRVDGPRGAFAGDVHVAVGVQRIIDLFSRIDLGPNGNIGLWNRTTLIARYAKDDTRGASVGSTTPSAELRALLGSGRKATSYHTRSGVDGISRVYYFRQVGSYPLYLVVGLADEDFLARWRGDSLAIAGLAGLFVVASMLFAALAYRTWRRLEADQEAMRRQGEAYTAALELSHQEAEAARRRSELILTSAGEGICGVDRESRIVFINPAARRMFGWGEAEGIGLDLHAETHHHRADGSPHEVADCAVFKTLGDGQRRQVKEELCWRKDGSTFPAELTVTAMEEEGRISGVVNVFRDITERKELEERITHMALFDELTDLPNRSFLTDALPRLTATAQRHHEVVGLLYVDLDGFKGINDTTGHAAGDAVLREVARRMKACVRAEDVVARLGGDEFLVITLTDRAGAAENFSTLARRIIEAVAEPIALAEGAVRTGASVGIAVFPDSDASIERCIQMADTAMYQAKKAGKACYAFAAGLEGQALSR